ncbi:MULTISPECIES: ABC transporter permease [Sphingomonas]|uniref:ABC transporter permease n=1 Tax=Sphingomonas TaxID=13687 RepID=UPI000F7DB6DE|nr:ABC transporter permease [Sphingomonas sp. ABOLF]RSV12335.1 ABC transporter permease [Sphingomonas sp. ABOLF]GLK20566.1 ABC transporter permease [Microbacterium terregens]
MNGADWDIQERDGSRTLHPSGDWTALRIGDAAGRLRACADFAGPPRRLDLSDIGKVDTAGVVILLRALAGGAEVDCAGREDLQRLIALVEPLLVKEREPERITSFGLTGFLTRFGRQVVSMAGDVYAMLEFFGHMMAALGRVVVQPRRLRLTPLVAVMQDVGINALPIVFIMTFFIGAVIALVGTNLLTTLGVEVFTVQLVGVAILREFGVVITAILLAGRSASSFAAQIGSMRMNQETDAMQVMGVDHFDALVTPRILAALVMMPLMTFVADIGGVLGGLLVSWATIDISPVFFVQRTFETVDVKHFWIGMSKAPFLALLIAASGCRHGMMVGGDVQSLGRNVTSAVVQSIFMTIMFDAVFAMIFMALDL